MSILRLSLLGTFQATVAGRRVERFDTHKTRALLAYLALENDQPQRRETLAALFWPDFNDSAALRNLRLTLFRLRQDLQQADPAFPFPFAVERDAIHPSANAALWVDVHELENLLTRCSAHRHANLLECIPCMEALAQAVALYRGELLQALSLKDAYGFEEWLLLRRERLHQQALEALNRLAEHFLWRAEHAASIEERLFALENVQRYSRRALQLEPWRESAHRALMHALALAGQVQEALAQYRACRQILNNEFGSDPDPQTLRLYQQIRGRIFDTRPLSIGPPNQSPARPHAAPARHNLPPQLTPLLGRATQLARIDDLLRTYRWVTLVGEGGVGKTRLALAAAEQALTRFSDGVWLIPLAEVGAPPECAFGESPTADVRRQIRQCLAGAIAEVLRLRPPQPEAGAPLLEWLFDHLRDKQMLLLLDSFEHLSDGADFILDLMQRAPQVCLLVTTRQFLHFQAGYVMRLDGLAAPQDEADPQAADYPAVQLFSERAERLSGSFHLDARSLPVVARICRLLDGLPLALELAAPWANRLSLPELEQALQGDLGLLATSMVGFPERHRSLRAVFESSWRLLSLDEQRLLACCAGLPGEFTYEQAFQAAQASPRDLELLADKFLLFKTAPGRYTLHQTLRHFAAEKRRLFP